MVLASSKLELSGPALFTHPSIRVPRILAGTKGEFAHIHLQPYAFASPAPVINAVDYVSTPGPAPQSLHLTLSPADAMLAIEKGWAVRHSASGMLGMPQTYVLIYAPRDEEELGIVEKLCDASVGFILGEINCEIQPPLAPLSGFPENSDEVVEGEVAVEFSQTCVSLAIAVARTNVRTLAFILGRVACCIAF